MWERTPSGGVRAGKQSDLAGCRGPQELLIGKPVPGSTPLAGRRGPQELQETLSLPFFVSLKQ
jgi:hypothetical protein